MRIEEVEQGLIGLPVLSVTSDPRSGSLFELGTWTRMKRPVHNPRLSEKLRNFRGSESMLVRCRWELDSPVDLVPPGAELRGFDSRSGLLEALVGSWISNAAFSAEPLEFLLEFNNNMTLKLFIARPVFCPETLEFFGRHSLSLGFSGGYWSIDPNGVIQEEQRS
jgi:hypothetical protein